MDHERISTHLACSFCRSHAVFTIYMEQQSLVAGGDAEEGMETKPDDILVSKFNFVDLAGSERLKKTGAQGETQKEGHHTCCQETVHAMLSCNRSLFVLIPTSLLVVIVCHTLSLQVSTSTRVCWHSETLSRCSVMPKKGKKPSSLTEIASLRDCYRYR